MRPFTPEQEILNQRHRIDAINRRLGENLGPRTRAGLEQSRSDALERIAELKGEIRG